MSEPSFHVITGASGAGKSTLLAALAELGYSVVPEAARALLQEQERCGGSLLPSSNLQGFMEEVLARNVLEHKAAQALTTPVFFDRGIPECLGHMRLLGLSVAPEQAALAIEHRYAGTVFVAEPWPEIYTCDRERRASFERAARSFEPTVTAYIDAGYRTCVLPKVSVRERAAFVLAQLAGGA